MAPHRPVMPDNAEAAHLAALVVAVLGGGGHGERVR
jgi:hypothetical protein